MSLWQQARDWFRPAGPPATPAPAPIPIPILTTRHCLYIARTIEAALANTALNGAVEIMFAPPAGGFGPGLHIVICPQIFDLLPDHFIAFQMEQTVSPRWFEPPLFAKLLKARAVVDYSRRNLAYLAAHGMAPERLYHLPVGYIEGFRAELPFEAPRHDVVFYGDANNTRRREFLDGLGRDYRVTELAKIFGDDLYRELRAAQVIVNIHYYEGALLETTRLMECLSLGCVVVSEESVDMEEYPELRELVDFVPLGDVAAMRERVGFWLNDPAACAERVAQARMKFSGGQRRFNAAVKALIKG